MPRSSNGVLTRLVWIMAALVAIYIGYWAGQLSVIDSCEKASFFHSHGKVFECLPYHSDLFDHMPVPK